MRQSYALVTGASRGIGRSVSLALSEAGWPLILVASKDLEGLQETAAEVKKRMAAHAPSSLAVSSKNVISLLCDLSDAGQVRHLFDSLSGLGIGHPSDHPSTISVLVNNAGIAHFDLVQDMSDETWNRILGVNLNSVFYTCRSVIPMMLHDKTGHIINISSYWGSHGSSMESAYCASKGAVNAFSLSLAQELEPSGILVNVLSPEYVETEMNAHLTEEEKRAAIEEMPSRKRYMPDEIANALLHILQADPPVTGQILLAEEALKLPQGTGLRKC